MSITPAPLDESLYDIREDEIEFYSKQTGIKDHAELKQHILAVQREAYSIYPYPCIRRFAFTSLKISRHPAYPYLLHCGRENPSAVFLDLGCCFGNDPRKAIADGFPANHVFASDLRPEFWELGHKLFKSTDKTCRVKFIPGNIFDESFAPAIPPSYDEKDVASPVVISQQSGNSLRQLVHSINFIHTASFFHLFEKEEQLIVAHRLAGLLSAKPGSMIFGTHTGSRTPGTSLRVTGAELFDHSPESWSDMWNGIIFEKGSVECSAFIREEKRKDYCGTIKASGDEVPISTLLVWSIKRL